LARISISVWTPSRERLQVPGSTTAILARNIPVKQNTKLFLVEIGKKANKPTNKKGSTTTRSPGLWNGY